MPYIPRVSIDGVTYDIKDLEARESIDFLTAATHKLDVGNIDLLPNNTNFNSLTTIGDYRVGDSTAAGTMSNIPEAKGGILTVFGTNSNSYINQLYQVSGGTLRKYIRYGNKSSGTWSAWSYLAIKSDIDNLDAKRNLNQSVNKDAFYRNVTDISGDFEQGAISSAGVQSDNTARCRSSIFYPVDTIRRIITSLDSGYSIGARFYNYDETFLSSQTLLDDGSIPVPANAALCKFVVFKTDSSDITPATVGQANIGVTFVSMHESQEDELHDTVLRNFSLEGAYKYTGYLNTAYEITENANHKTTDYISVKAGDTFTYSLVSGGYVFAVYNMSMERVDTVGARTVLTVVSGTYTIAQDGFIRFSNRVSTYTQGYVKFDVSVPDSILEIMKNSGSPVQPYFEEEMDDTITKVLALRTEPSIVFPIVTDIHYRYNNLLPAEQFDRTMDNILYFTKHVKCDFVINLGDSSDGRADRTTQIAYCNEQAKRFAEISIPYYFVSGNHELNIYSGGGYNGTDKMNIEQLYTLFFNCLPQAVTRNPDNYTDYYVDIPAYNVRLVILNMCHPNTSSLSNAYHVDSSTVSWYQNTALDSSKTILLFTHYSPIANSNSYPTVYGDTNIGQIATITETFVNNGGTLINIYGHSHADFKFTSPYLQISLCCAKCHQTDISTSAYDYLRLNSDIVSPTRELGTVSEDCWTVAVLRPLSGKLDLIRFGAGSDRTGITYTS